MDALPREMKESERSALPLFVIITGIGFSEASLAARVQSTPPSSDVAVDEVAVRARQAVAAVRRVLSGDELADEPGDLGIGVARGHPLVTFGDRQQVVDDEHDDAGRS